MATLDFGPATRTMARLVAGTRDEQLGDPTPCPAYDVADLIDHIGSLTQEFTRAARKGPRTGELRGVDGDQLEPGWRERIAGDLETIVAAWSEPGAYDGMTEAGPVELPAPVAAQVALNELVVHGWDLATATGQAFEADPGAVEACLAFVESFEPPPDAPADTGDGGLFGPPVDPGPDAAPLDRLIGLTGRQPAP